jgi:hypothetical protein
MTIQKRAALKGYAEVIKRNFTAKLIAVQSLGFCSSVV